MAWCCPALPDSRWCLVRVFPTNSALVLLLCQATGSLITVLRHKQVRVSGEGQTRSPYYAELEAAQQAAEAKGLGLWTKVRC